MDNRMEDIIDNTVSEPSDIGDGTTNVQSGNVTSTLSADMLQDTFQQSITVTPRVTSNCQVVISSASVPISSEKDEGLNIQNKHATDDIGDDTFKQPKTDHDLVMCTSQESKLDIMKNMIYEKDKLLKEKTEEIETLKQELSNVAVNLKDENAENTKALVQLVEQREWELNKAHDLDKQHQEQWKCLKQEMNLAAEKLKQENTEKTKALEELVEEKGEKLKKAYDLDKQNQEQLKCLGEELGEAKSRMLKMETENTKRQDEINRLKDSRENIGKELDSYKGTVKRLEAEVKKKDNQCKNRAADINRLSKEIEDKRGQLEQAYKKIDRKQDEVNREKLLREHSLKEIESYKSTVKSLEKGNEMKEEDRKKQEDLVKELTEEYANIIEDKANKIYKLKENVDELQHIKKQKEQMIKKQQEEIGKLKGENFKIRQKSRQTELRLESFQKQAAQLKAQKQQLQSDVSRKCQEIKQKEDVIYKLELDMKQKEIDHNSLMKERDNLSKRLSEEWSHKVSMDERNIENISIKNRPMNIASEYTSMCSNQWLDAKGDLDQIDGVTEEDKQRLLCDILLSAEKFAVDRHDHIMKSFALDVNQPLMQESFDRQRNGLEIEGNWSQSKLNKVQRMQKAEELNQKNANENGYNKDQLIMKPSHLSNEVNDSLASGLNSTGMNTFSEVTAQTSWTCEKCLFAYNECDGKCHCEQGKQLTYDGNMQNTMLENHGQFAYQDNDNTYSSAKINSQPQAMPMNKDLSHEGPDCKQQFSFGKYSEVAEILPDDISLGLQLPDNMKNMIGDFIRLHADGIQTRDLELDILWHLAERSKSAVWLVSASHCENFHTYIAACASLSWKMIIQRPRMSFDFKGINCHWDENTQEPAYASDNPADSKAKVKYYLCPSLYHAEKLMVKGKVMVKIYDKDK